MLGLRFMAHICSYLVLPDIQPRVSFSNGEYLPADESIALLCPSGHLCCGSFLEAGVSPPLLSGLV